ncbi:hypothetical protein R0J91_15185, partial [Micrococcus sp. SIMBA_131]
DRPVDGAATGNEPLGEAAPSPQEQDAALAASLQALAGAERDEAGGTRAPEAALDGGRRGIALLAAGLGYFAREHKPLWWAMFDRAVSAPDEWQE